MWCVSEAPSVSLGYPRLGTLADIAITIVIFHRQEEVGKSLYIKYIFFYKSKNDIIHID